MILNDKKTVRVKRDYECSVEELFLFWQPEKMVSWWKNLKEVEIPQSVGKEVVFRWHNFDGQVSGKLEKFSENREIGFSWKSSKSGNESNVKCIFESSGVSSRLTIVHENNANFEDASSHNHGWAYCLEHLGKVVDQKPREKEIVLKRTFNAPIDMVFEAWTTPSHMARWMNDDVKTQAVCKTDFKIGGSFRLDYNDQDGSIHSHYGEYKEILRPNKIVFSWMSDHTDGETEVTVDLKENDLQTDLILTHRFFRGQKEADDHKEGWGSLWDVMEKIFKD